MPGSSARNPDGKLKVLVYLMGSLGDSIVSIPALRAVRRHFGDAEIVALQNFHSGGRVLASEVIPVGLVNRYLSYESTKRGIERLAEMFRLWRTLRRERFDAAAYLISSERPERDVHRDRSFFRSAGISDVFGFHPIPSDELYPTGDRGRPGRSEQEAVLKLRRLALDGIEFQRTADLGTPLISPSSSDLKDIEKWLGEKGIADDVPLISIAPGCKQQVNEWPLENFVELGRRLSAGNAGTLVITGGPAEAEAGERLAAAWGGGINAAGALSVKKTAALLSRCRFHIGLDTGTTHLAAAAGTRCFSIYGGRNNPGLWYPIGPDHSIVHHPVACSPCRSETCRVPGHPCMTRITVDDIWPTLMEFMNEETRPRDLRVIEVSK